MSNWAIIKAAKVTNIIVSASIPLVNPGESAVRIDGLNPAPHIGWIYLNWRFSPPQAPQVDTVAYLTDKVKSAIAFGNSLIVDYAVQNIIAGKQTSEVKEILDRLSTLMAMLKSGSLYTALEELDRVHADNLITQPTIDQFKGKIRTYLGMP